MSTDEDFNQNAFSKDKCIFCLFFLCYILYGCGLELVSIYIKKYIYTYIIYFNNKLKYVKNVELCFTKSTRDSLMFLIDHCYANTLILKNQKHMPIIGLNIYRLGLFTINSSESLHLQKFYGNLGPIGPFILYLRTLKYSNHIVFTCLSKNQQSCYFTNSKGDFIGKMANLVQILFLIN